MPRRVCFHCCFVSRITQKLAGHMSCSMAQGRTHYILERIRVKGRIQEFVLPL